MTTNALDNQLQNYWALLGLEEKKSLLSYIQTILKPKDATKRLTIEEYNKELEAAEARIDAGHFTLHEDVLKQAETWI